MLSKTDTFRRTKQPRTKIGQIIAGDRRLADRLIYNQSFFEFLKGMWPAVSAEELQMNWHIELMCEELQAIAEDVASRRFTKDYHTPVGDLIFNVPPGSTKTTTVMIMFPAWCWTRWYWMEFICLSYSSGLSLESAEQSRELVRSDEFQEIYPDLSIKRDKDQKSNFKILKTFEKKPGVRISERQGGSRYSTSVGGTVTGFHGHMILVDDPINPEQAVSEVQLRSANRWLTSTMPTRKIHKAVSPTVMIMQRLHEDDPTGHILNKKKENIKHICLPAEIRNYKDKVRPAYLVEKYEDDLLDPSRMGWGVLNSLTADLGQYGAAGQLGQSPTPPAGGMFKVDRFQIVDSLPQKWEVEQICRYWDKAGTEIKPGQSRKAAYSVGLKMAKLKGGKWIILNVTRGQWSSEQREDEIKKTAQADGPDVRIGIEQEPGSGGKESAENTVKNLSGYNVSVESPQGNKVHRADPLSVQVNWGNVLLLQGEWNGDLIEEFRFFPFGNYKDQVDAGSGAFRLLNAVKEAKMW